MKRVIEGRYRLGVICREGREFKMNRVFRDLPPQWEMEILISQQLARADVDRLAGYDIVFYKSRAGRLLRLLEQVEARGKKVINPVAAVRLSKRRSECLERAAAQGVPVPRQYTGPLKEIPFDRYVVKSEHESESYPRGSSARRRRATSCGSRLHRTRRSTRRPSSTANGNTSSAASVMRSSGSGRGPRSSTRTPRPHGTGSS